jgi:hypothetical protein
MPAFVGNKGARGAHGIAGAAAGNSCHSRPVEANCPLACRPGAELRELTRDIDKERGYAVLHCLRYPCRPRQAQRGGHRRPTCDRVGK